jgi:hypothetical protein
MERKVFNITMMLGQESSCILRSDTNRKGYAGVRLERVAQ